MKTNQNQAQEQSAQLIAPEATQPEQPAKPLYNPDEVAQIVKHLTDGYFDPEYILLFGKLVGGTTHSDAMTYDLLMVVRETPEYDWIRAKRILRYKVPIKRREVSYINLYIMTLRDVETHRPFFTSRTPRENCSIAATITISAAQNTRSTLPRLMPMPNCIMTHSECSVMS